jgi:hypothetical protein
MSAQAEEFANRIIGARIVAVEEVGAMLVRIEFEHRGTDDDSGWMVVSLENVLFADEAAAGGGHDRPESESAASGEVNGKAEA